MLKHIVKNFSRAHLFTGVNQMSRILYSLLMIILVPLYLTKAEQGYWFSFMSLSALMVIADSGFSNIILQFAAHEFAFLKFNAAGSFEGDEKHLKRLGSFLRFSLKWSAGVVLVALPVIAVAGWYIMSRHPAEAFWQAPWLVYVTGSVLVFFENSLLYFFEGCDSVPKTQKIRAQISVIMIIALCSGLMGGFKLYSLALSTCVSALAGAFLIFRRFGSAAYELLAVGKGLAHSWRREFLPLLGRYSLSWVSGYLIFQMYTPLMFHYYGPVAAGKIGISIALWTGVLTLSNIWLSVVTPKINIHISKKQWLELDRLFFRNLAFSAATFLMGIITVFSLLALARGHFQLADRFVSPLSMAFLAGGWGLQVVINGLAVYLRAHKEEPLVLPSILTAVYIVIVTYLSAKFLSSDYFFLGFFTSYIWCLPWVVWIFKDKRKHNRLNERPFEPPYDSNTAI